MGKFLNFRALPLLVVVSLVISLSVDVVSAGRPTRALLQTLPPPVTDNDYGTDYESLAPDYEPMGISKSRKLMQFAQSSEEPPKFSIRSDAADALNNGADWFRQQSTGIQIAIGVGAAVAGIFVLILMYCLCKKCCCASRESTSDVVSDLETGGSKITTPSTPGTLPPKEDPPVSKSRATWAVALKHNQVNYHNHPDKQSKVKYSGKDAQCMDAGESQWKMNDINNWLRSKILMGEWDGWILYNDQPPHTKGDDTKYGHCKGIVAWNNKTVGWLIHSSPHWPAVFSNTSISDIPERHPFPRHPEDPAAIIKGQSFVWTTVTRGADLACGLVAAGGIDEKSFVRKNALKAIFDQIIIMNAHVYLDHRDFAEYKYKTSSSLDKYNMQVVILDSDVFPSPGRLTHLAKNHLWVPPSGHFGTSYYGYDRLQGRPDIYHSGVRVAFGSMYTKTHIASDHGPSWTPPDKPLKVDGGLRDEPYPCDEEVMKVNTVCFLNRPRDNPECGGKSDHSKWAISKKESSEGWTLIGDMNRNIAQSLRGGGGLVIKDEKLRKKMQEHVGNYVWTGY